MVPFSCEASFVRYSLVPGPQFWGGGNRLSLPYLVLWSAVLSRNVSESHVNASSVIRPGNEYTNDGPRTVQPSPSLSSRGSGESVQMHLSSRFSVVPFSAGSQLARRKPLVTTQPCRVQYHSIFRAPTVVHGYFHLAWLRGQSWFSRVQVNV